MTSTPSSSASVLPRTVHALHLLAYSPVTFTDVYEFCNNEIKTSIYTIWNFLPKVIYEQLHSMSVVFFILVAIIHMFADGATSVFAIIGPLSFVLLVSLLKDAIYDILRHRRDKQVNERKYPVMVIDQESNTLQWKLIQSKHITVGDVIMCKNDEEFPCDLIILATSSNDCSCRLTTVNLDGESTIKTHYSILDTHNIYKNYLNDSIIYSLNNEFNDIIKTLFIRVDCQQPNEDFSHFEGSITLSNGKLNQPLKLNNILYRGAKLKTTRCIIGLVVYTGRDTKLLLNSKQPKRKYSSRESRANVILITFMIIMSSFCIIFSVLTKNWSMHYLTNPFIPAPNFKYWSQVKDVFRFLFILNYLIPISLIITVEIQQILAAYFISSDLEMYDVEQDVATKSNTPQLIDELGQIKYLFSDKTGTLTQNEMLLHTIAVLNTNKVYVFNEEYENINDIQQQQQTNSYKSYICKSEVYRLKEISRRKNQFGHIGVIYEKLIDNNTGYYEDNLAFESSSDSETDIDEEMEDEIADDVKNRQDVNKIKGVNRKINNLSLLTGNHPRFSIDEQLLPDELLKCLTTLALCHTVEINRSDEDKQNSVDQITKYLNMENFYQASSIDEKALVIGAAKLGVRFMGSSTCEQNSSSRIYRVEYDQCICNKNNGNYGSNNNNDNSQDQFVSMEYIIDSVLEFDSFRKRMTVMARHPDGTCYIHCKGAESSIFEISNLSPTHAHKLANKHVTQFAMDGLRTLVYASRQVNSSEYHELLAELQHANTLFGPERVNALKVIYSKIECNLTLVSVTGVEDKLQPDVEQTLKSLREAGIQVWVLTGDKEETAITVSRSAGHFAPNMNLVRLTNCEDFLSLASKLFSHLDDLKVRRRGRSTKQRIKNCVKKSFDLIKDKTDKNLYDKNEITENFDNQRVSSIAGLKKLFTNKIQVELNQPRHRHSQRPGSACEPIGLVIDGKSLRYALHPSLQSAFLDLCLHLTTVLCCRMTPLQKASVVQLVRTGLADYGESPVTAAIGDGGNDVAMLLQANIGIGVFGKEGKEAVRASDYAIPQFKYLQRLLLVHGHRSNYRICMTMNLFYYKCVTFVTTQILYTFYSGYSAVSTFETVLFSIYNLTVTSLMCLLFGMFERHLPDKILNDNPYLYRLLTRQANLRSWYIWLWIFDGIWHGSVIFYAATYIFLGGGLYSEGTFYESYGNVQHLFDMSLYGCATYLFVWLSVTLRIFIVTRDFNIVVFGGFLVTMIVNTIILMALQSTTTLDNINLFSYTKLSKSAAFWFTLPIVLTIANIPSLIWRIMSDAWWNLQIQLSNIPQKHIRRKYRRSLSVWIRALTTSYLGNSPDQMYQKNTDKIES
ncbi:unnamed protein product [Trichobilharzia szidati]|nr:unnamed protein product [Trichobilharzia szidati]